MFPETWLPNPLTMNAPNTAPASALEALLFGAPSDGPPSTFAAAMILVMLDAGEGISDLIFSPGRAPQVERHGQLMPVGMAEVPVLKPEHTARVARELIGGNERVLRILKEEGACDLSYSIPNCARFRV